MRTARNFAVVIATSLALFAAAPVAASDPPGREVRINKERFDQLGPEEQQRVLALKARLEVLMSTDRTTLQPEQRAALRSEWRDLKHELKEQNANGQVLYISTGALIIIILLLIIIL